MFEFVINDRELDEWRDLLLSTESVMNSWLGVCGE